MQNNEGRIQKGGVSSRDRPNATHATHGTNGARREVPQWWQMVPQSEKAVIRDVVTAIRGLKRSKSAQISQAARKWERGIVCFIKFRLMGGASTKGERGRRGEGGRGTSNIQHRTSNIEIGEGRKGGMGPMGPMGRMSDKS